MQCPLCSNSLMRQIDHDDVNWFCNHCWLTLPDLDQVLARKPIVRPSRSGQSVSPNRKNREKSTMQGSTPLRFPASA